MGDGKKAGCFVSGGLGSASVAYYMKKSDRHDFSTLSVGFQGQNEEDLKAATRVVNKLELKNTMGLITPKNILDDFVSIVWHLDEPMADPNVIATWNLARLASDQCQTVFSGMGSDEILAGHSRYTLGERKLPFLTLLAQFFHPVIQHALAPALNLISPNASYKLLRESKTNPWQAGYLQSNALCDEKLLGEIAPNLKGLFDLDILLHKFHNLSRVKSLVSSFIYIDVKTRLADLYIAQYDRLTSAFGLDWRTPFLDEYIIEYLAGFAEPENLVDKDTASCLKIILRDVFPPDVINRPKRTRKNFLKSWLEHTELPSLFPLLQKGVLVEAGIISPHWLESNIATPDKQRAAFPYLWAVLALEIWYRLYINFPTDEQCHYMSLKQLLSKT
jgi:asparagine synthase (glutamine-hydrolysing)